MDEVKVGSVNLVNLSIWFTDLLDFKVENQKPN